MRWVLGGWSTLLGAETTKAEIEWLLQSFQGGPASTTSSGCLIGVGWKSPTALGAAAKEAGLLFDPLPSLDNWKDSEASGPFLVLLHPDLLEGDLATAFSAVRNRFDRQSAATRRRCMILLIQPAHTPPPSGAIDLECQVRDGQFQLIFDRLFTGGDEDRLRSWRLMLATSEARTEGCKQVEASSHFNTLFPNDPVAVDELSNNSDIVYVEPGDPLFIKSNLANYVYIPISGDLDVYYGREYRKGQIVDPVGLKVARLRPLGDWEMGIPLDRGRYEGSAFCAGVGPARAIRVSRPVFRSLVHSGRKTLESWLYRAFLRNNYEGSELVGTDFRPGTRGAFTALTGVEPAAARDTVFNLRRHAMAEAEALVSISGGAVSAEHGQIVMWSYRKNVSKMTLPALNALRHGKYIGWCSDRSGDGAVTQSKLARARREEIVSDFKEWILQRNNQLSSSFSAVLAMSIGRSKSKNHSTEESKSEIISSEKITEATVAELKTYVSAQSYQIRDFSAASKIEFALGGPLSYVLMRWLLDGEALCIRDPFGLHEVQFDKAEALSSWISRLGGPVENRLAAGQGKMKRAIHAMETSRVCAHHTAHLMGEFAKEVYSAIFDAIFSNLYAHITADKEASSERPLPEFKMLARSDTLQIPHKLQDVIDQACTVSVLALEEYDFPQAARHLRAVSFTSSL